MGTRSSEARQIRAISLKLVRLGINPRTAAMLAEQEVRHRPPPYLSIRRPSTGLSTPVDKSVGSKL